MTDTQVIIAREEAGQHATSAREVLGLLDGFVVTSDADQEFAAGLLREIKGKLKGLEKRRTAITVPLNDALREVNALFRPAREALEQGERIVKQAIAGYLSGREAERRLVLAEAARATTVVEAEEALARVEPATAPPAGVSVRRVQKFEVVDEDAVPRELCSPDLGKIRLALAAGEVVPGVRVYEEAIVASRGVS